MQIRPVCFSIDFADSANRRAWSRECASEFPDRRAAPPAPFPKGEGRVRVCAQLLGALCIFFSPMICCAQDALNSTAVDQTATAEPVVVSATRFDIPLDQSPSSISIIDSQDLDQKQIERVSDALREVPGLNVVQTGTPGQLTSVFMRGLPSEDMQVLLNGIPINQGLAGQFDFANLTTDNIDRIEVARGPQSTIYGPRALAGVVQIFTKQGTGPPGFTLTSEGGTYDTFRETIQSDGKVGDFDYSLGASRIDTDNAR